MLTTALLAVLSFVPVSINFDLPQPVIISVAQASEAPVPTPDPEPVDLKSLANEIAEAHMIPTTTLANLVWSESRWDPDAESKTGDCGLTQINITQNPSGKIVPCEKAKDPVYALNFAAQYIAEGESDRWVACNCYLLVKVKIPDLPKMAEIVPNSAPHVGAVVILYYRDNVTGEIVKHVAIVTKISEKGFTVLESNFDPCLIGHRFIVWDDTHIAGFWSP